MYLGVGFRRTSWAPLGKAPLRVTQFHRDSDTKYYQRVLKMKSCSLVYSAALQVLLSLSIS
ncbi:hypothetical protein PITC_057820 [Penicillium italicum]|uniref:Uncharacterized protein n=1 Tax=Penicillium italicum TaxID=40296 RepID=A0A0A2L575_PENIT|nr:hypothetical protein PITC_057820 [Penicillium italicum]